MKKLHTLFLAATLLLGAAFSTYTLTASIEPPAPVEANCNHGQCQATAKSTGQRCKHCVSNPGDAFCWQHKPK